MKRILAMTDNEQAEYLKFVINYRYRLDIWKDRLDDSHTRYVELIKDTTISKEFLRKVCILDDIRCFDFVVHKFKVECSYDYHGDHAITVRWYLNKYAS